MATSFYIKVEAEKEIKKVLKILINKQLSLFFFFSLGAKQIRLKVYKL